MVRASSTHHITRPLDPLAAAVVVLLCLSWGFNYVAMKVAIPDIPPLTQAAIRSTLAALIVVVWCRLRGIPLFARDGTLVAGIATGLVFGIEFILIYQGMLYTTATRAVLFVYLAPFFVVLGARIFLPADRFTVSQWLGLTLSFAGMLLAFGVPTPALDPRQMIGDLMMVGAALLWATTTLLIKATPLARASAEKVLLYQLAVSGPLTGVVALIVGERIVHMPSAVALGSLTYQTFVASVTFAAWFALVVRYSANRLSAFSFLTPLFGVVTGHLILNEPITPVFVAAVALVVFGLVLVNRVK